MATALVVGGYWGFKAYPKWRQQRMLVHARTALDKADYKAAALAMRYALKVDPNNLEATRMMAELTEKLESPNSVYWHRRLAEREPGVFEHYLRWGRAAIRAGEIPLAEQALEAVPEVNRNAAVYHHLAASVALGSKQMERAEAACQEALKLAPTNEIYQVDLATVQIQSTNAAKAEAGRQALEKLSETSAYSVQTLRSLIAFEAKQGRGTTAMALSKRLQAHPKAQFTDKLQYLNFLRASKSSETTAYLAELKKTAGLPGVLPLTAWFIAAGRGKEAHDWLAALPKEVQGEQTVQLAMSDCLVSRRDWPAVDKFLKTKVWEDFDFMRLAILARAAREQGNSAKAQSDWNSAMRLAARRYESIFILARLAKEWNWDAEMVETLWVIARSPYNPQWALGSLARHFRGRGDTAGLLRVAQRVAEIKPDDSYARNNVAQLALLMRTAEGQAHKQASELFKKEPTNAVFVSTYAYSQWRQGRAADAVKTMESLPATQLNDPAMAAYFGSMLAAAGDTERAKNYLSRATNAPLLPEEKAFVTAAKATIR